MKKLTLIFILMLSLLVGKGQNLLQEGKLWSNTSIGTMPGSTYSSYFIKFLGDTTINELVYKKIWKSDDALHSQWALNGCIREEPATQKVFIYNEYTDKDMLLYDFSLEEGDSILAYDGLPYLKVVKVINATFGSSPDTRKQIYFFDPNGNTRWIEGIGSTWGILEGLNSFFTTGATSSLVCYSENDQLMYHNPKFINCFPEGVYSDFNSHFIDPTNVWIIESKVFNMDHWEPAISLSYKFIGDTIVSNKSYTKLYYSTKVDQSKLKLHSLWREDETGKLYQIIFEDFEIIKYDFNLTVGDTMKNNNKHMDAIVDSVVIKPFGSVNKKYLYLHLIDIPTHILTWVDGVGSLFSPNMPDELWVTGGTSKLICFEENGVLVYHNSEYANCFFTSSFTVQNPVKEIIVYPNPVSGELFVQFLKTINEGFTLQLYSLKGDLVRTECLERGSNLYRFDVSSLKSGVYFLHLLSVSGNYVEEVIIKE